MDLIFALVLGSATPGGGFPIYGDAFAAMVNAQEPKLRIEPRNTKGSTENVALLEANQIDLALVLGEIASAALSKPGSQLRIITAMYASPGVLMVRGDSPYRSLADLRDNPVVLGAPAPAITQLARTVFTPLPIALNPLSLHHTPHPP